MTSPSGAPVDTTAPHVADAAGSGTAARRAATRPRFGRDHHPTHPGLPPLHGGRGARGRDLSVLAEELGVRRVPLVRTVGRGGEIDADAAAALSTGRGRASRRAERSTPPAAHGCRRAGARGRRTGPRRQRARPHLPLDPPSAAVPRPSEHPGGRHAAAGARQRRRVPLPGGCIREAGRRRSGRVDLPRPTRGWKRARPARRRRAGAIRARPQRGRGERSARHRAEHLERSVEGPWSRLEGPSPRPTCGPTGAGAERSRRRRERGRGSPPSDRGRGRRT